MKKFLIWLGRAIILIALMELGIYGLHQLALRNSPSAFAPASSSSP